MTLEQCWHRVPGGTARAALELIEALRAHAVDLVGVAAFHRSGPVGGFEPTIPVATLPLPRRALYELWHRARWPAVEKATGPVDLVHATGLAMPPRRVPLVWTLHDLAFIRDPSHFTRHGLRFFHAALGLALQEADVVLCSSEATRRDAVAAGFDEGRLRVVPLGAHQRRAPESEVARVKARHGLDRPYVLHVGTAEPRKNLVGLLSAMDLIDHPDVELVLVGPPGWGPDLEHRIATTRRRVRTLGFVSSDELGPLYAGAAVFCYPSLWEGFGLPVLEALVQGTPTITSAGTATEEVAGDAAILVDPHDPQALAASLDRLLSDRSLQDALRSVGPTRASGFTWERTATATRAVYREVLERS